MESFWSTLKTETELDAFSPISRRAAELAVFDYIETSHNPTRRHSSLGYVSLWPSKTTKPKRHQSRLI